MNEAAITLSDVLRKYPQKYQVEGCVQVMVSKIKEIDEPKSLAAVIWMLGEYSEEIKNANEVFMEVSDTFKDME